MNDHNTHGKIRIVLWLGAFSIVWIFLDPSYQGNVFRHLLMEIGGSILALIVTVMAFNCSEEGREYPPSDWHTEEKGIWYQTVT